MSQQKSCRLADILTPRANMKIVIDDGVGQDENGCFLVHVGYLRVSTDRQADVGFGLEIQEDDVVRYCKANGFSNLVLFIDDGYTGTNMDRPALNAITRMIQDYNTGRSSIRVKTLVVPRIDRLGRTLLGTLQFIQDYIVSRASARNSKINANRDDIDFVSVAESYARFDANNPQGKFLLMLFASLAEFDRDQIVGKLKRGRRARVASGKWMGGGKVPYGYRYDRGTGTLVVVPEEAETVREIFRLFIEEKVAPQKIADRFGFSGDRAITQILRNKTRTGCIVYNNEEYPGFHEAIIPLAVWEEAQEELERRSVHRTATDYLLSGLVWCGDCGCKMRYQKYGKRIKLVCYASQDSTRKRFELDHECENKCFFADEVEKAVIDELFRLSYLGQVRNGKSPGKEDTLAALSRDLSAAKRKLGKLYDFEEENGTDDVLQDKILDTRKRIASIERQIEEEEENEVRAQKVRKAGRLLRNLKSTWPDMTDTERQDVCQRLIDRVELSMDGTVRVRLKLESYLLHSEAEED